MTKGREYLVYVMDRKEAVLVTAISACICMFAGLLFFRNIFVSFVFLSGVIFIRRAYCMHMLDVQQAKMLSQFQDLLHSLSASFSVNKSMGEAIRQGRVVVELVHGRKAILAQELEIMYRSIVENNVVDTEVWDDFGKRSGIEDIENFARTYSTCKETGGNIIKAVGDACEVISEKISISKEIKAITNQKKVEGRIILIMPVAVLTLLNLFAYDYIAPMYTSSSGRIMMGMALGLLIVAVCMVEKITRIRV